MRLVVVLEGDVLPRLNAAKALLCCSEIAEMAFRTAGRPSLLFLQSGVFYRGTLVYRTEVLVMTRSPPTPTPTPSAGIQSVVWQALEDRRLVVAVIRVARDGELIHPQAVGFADRESVRPMDLKAVFRLSSMSKPIVTTAALMLLAQGQLDLEPGIECWLLEFQPTLADGREVRITVRQLLSDTAGLGYRFFEVDADGYYARAGVSDGMNASDISLTENLRRLATVPLLYAPGTAWGYSLATDVLGALIERIHGRPLDEAVQQYPLRHQSGYDRFQLSHYPQRWQVHVLLREFPRWGGLATLGWSLRNWSASGRVRYIGRTQIGSSDLEQGLSAD